MAAAFGKKREPEGGYEVARHAKYLATEKHLRALAREAAKVHKMNAEIIVKYSPYSRPIDFGSYFPKIEKTVSHHQMKLKKRWNRRHPEVIAVNSRDMIPTLPKLARSQSETKVKPQSFVHTTRIAAWRATRFKGKGARPGKQGPNGSKPLQGLTYADFLREVATMRKQGDASAVESQHGGIQRLGGMPLIFPYVPKKYDQITKDRLPVWMDPKTIQEKRAKEAERQKELKRQEREQELRKKERAKQRDKNKFVKMQDNKESPHPLPHPVGDYTATSMTSVCSCCSLAARRPLPGIWIDPNILKAPRTKNSLWKRTVETSIQTDPIVPPRSGSAHREDAWWFLQDADPSETSLQADSSTVMSPEYDADQYDPELSIFLQDVIRSSLLDTEIVKPAVDSATLGKGFILKDFGEDSRRQDVCDKPTFADEQEVPTDFDQPLNEQQVSIDVYQTDRSPEKTSWPYPETGVAQSAEEPTSWPCPLRIGDQGTLFPSGVADKGTAEEYTQVTPPGSVSPPWQFRDYHVPLERRPSEEEGLVWPFPPGKPDKWPQWPFPIAQKKMLPRPTSCPPSILRQYSEDEIPTWPFKPDKPREEMPEWPFPVDRHALGVRWPCGFFLAKSSKNVDHALSCPSLLRNQYSEDEIPTWPFQPGKPQKMQEWPFPLGKYPFGVRWPCGIFPSKSEKPVPRAASCPPAPLRGQSAFDEDPNWPFQPGKPRKVKTQWPFPRGRHPLGVRWPCGLFPEGSDKILPRSHSCPPRLKRQYSIDEEPNWPFQPGRLQELQQWPFPWGRHPLGIRWPCGLFPAELDKDEEQDYLLSFDEALLEDGLIVSCGGKETDLPQYINNVILDGCQQYQREEGLLEMPVPFKNRDQWKEQQLNDKDALEPALKQKDKLTEDMVEGIVMEEIKQPVVSEKLKEEAQIAATHEKEDKQIIFDQEAGVTKNVYGENEPHRDTCLDNLEDQAQVKSCIDKPSVDEFGKVHELSQQDVYEEPALEDKQDVPTDSQQGVYEEPFSDKNDVPTASQKDDREPTVPDNQDNPTDFYQAPTTVEGQVLIHIDKASTEAVPDSSPEKTTWPYPANGMAQSAEEPTMSEKVVLKELAEKQEVVVSQETKLEDDKEKHNNAERHEVTKPPEEEQIRKEKEGMQQQKLFKETTKAKNGKRADKKVSFVLKKLDVKKEEDVNMTEAIKQTQAAQEEKLADMKKKGGEDTEKK